MYEARQNKEKVSRRIDGGGMTRQMAKIDNCVSKTTRSSIQNEPILQMVRLVGIVSCPDPPAFLNGQRLDRHHIIPNSVIQHFVEDTFHAAHNSIDALVQVFDQQWNGMFLPLNRIQNGNYGRPAHGAPHFAYNQAVEQYIMNNFQNGLLDLGNAENRTLIAQHIKTAIHNTQQLSLDGMAMAGEI